MQELGNMIKTLLNSATGFIRSRIKRVLSSLKVETSFDFDFHIHVTKKTA